jgi:2-polyprenyl-3-methyl-5-hydroxy-6-metoxy-1,4-benzoquinol methylase
MVNGAPGVVLASEILREAGLFRDIHGIDIVTPGRELAATMARMHRIHLYSCNAVERSLPRGYDVILLANVHRHLNRPLQERMLSNLGASLTGEGRLFVNWRFSDGMSPTICLQRNGGRLTVVSESNTR